MSPPIETVRLVDSRTLTYPKVCSQRHSVAELKDRQEALSYKPFSDGVCDTQPFDKRKGAGGMPVRVLD
jgi:hypothetical protein